VGKKRIKRKKSGISTLGGDQAKLTFVSYDIVFDPIEDKKDIYKDPELDQAKEKIYYDTHKNPKKCVSRLLPLIEKYPDDPVLYNYLYAAYSLMGEQAKADDITIETYRKFPDYLFGKIGYVEKCLRDDNLDEIPRILDNKYDLKSHYPDRTKFHITEFTSFVGTVGFYFCRIKKLEIAEKYYEILKGVAPNDPQTKRLESALKISRSMTVLEKLTRLIGKKP